MSRSPELPPYFTSGSGPVQCGAHRKRLRPDSRMVVSSKRVRASQESGSRYESDTSRTFNQSAFSTQPLLVMAFHIESRESDAAVAVPLGFSSSARNSSPVNFPIAQPRAKLMPIMPVANSAMPDSVRLLKRRRFELMEPRHFGVACPPGRDGINRAK